MRNISLRSLKMCSIANTVGINGKAALKNMTSPSKTTCASTKQRGKYVVNRRVKNAMCGTRPSLVRAQ